MKTPEPRHTVERLPDGVRVVLPSKRNFIRIVWFGFMIPWSLLFTWMTFYVLGGLLFRTWVGETISSDEIGWQVLISIFSCGFVYNG